MSSELPKGKIYIVGTMRTGSSVITNMLNAHSEIMVLGECIHFFRFIYKYYEPLNRKNIERMLKEMHARVYWRYKLNVDVEEILNDIDSSGYNYRAIYEAIMRFYLKKLGKVIAGEDVALHWTEIPEFLRLFPEAKIIQICRDPRSIVASWGKSSYQKIDYLITIFNCIDNFDKCSYYSKFLPKENYLFVRYEDSILTPEKVARRICDFIGVGFEPLMIQPEKWDDIFDGVYVKRGWSSHTGKKHKGFDSSRIDMWKESLKDWELCLCEWLAKDRMEKFGYELSGRKFDVNTILKGVDILRKSPILNRCLTAWLTLNHGWEGYPADPREPSTWGVPLQIKKQFIDTEDGKSYLKAMEAIRDEYE